MDLVKPFVHQGTDEWLQFASSETILPIWVAICIILCCLMFSALFSGLNLGLMSLDRTELKVVIKPNKTKFVQSATQLQFVRNQIYIVCFSSVYRFWSIQEMKKNVNMQK